MATKVSAGIAATATQPARGNLFEGKTFWLSKSTPSRSRFVNDILSNGGTRTEREDLADYKIADHMKTKHAPHGSVSYQFLEQCMREGAIVDHQSHLIFPETRDSRPVGSVQHPSKQRRTAYTPQDDDILRKWVQNCDGPLHGNRVFQDLEDKYPHHTWQSWRDRYVKRRYANVGATPPDSPSAPIPPSSESTQRQRETVAEPAQASPTNTQAPRVLVHGTEIAPELKEANDNESVNESEQRLARSTQHVSTTVVNGQGDDEESVTMKVENPFMVAASLEEDEEIDEEAEEQAEAKEYQSEEESVMLSEEGDEEGDVSQDEQEDKSEDEPSSPSPFTEEDFQTLLSGSKSIMNIEPNSVHEAWATYAKNDLLERTGERWRDFWETNVRPVYEQQREQRRLAGIPSPGSVATDTEAESSREEEEESVSRASPDGSDAGTPHPMEGRGIEILADDGKRHLSTPIRTKNSQAEKRKQQDEGHESDSTAPVGERSPLKRRRLNTGHPPAQSSSVVEDSEAEEDTTQAQAAFHTAPTGHVSSQVEHIDLSQLTDGHESSDSDSSAAFEDSGRFETARTARREVEDEEEPANTQGHIDAQLLSEMSSAAQQTSSPASQRRKRGSPSPRHRASLGTGSRDAKNSIFLESEESQSAAELSSESDTDLDAVVVTRSTPRREFAPIAFQTSPQSSTPRPTHTLLPPFSNEPLYAKARGKQRQRQPSSRADETGASTQEAAANELSANDLPAWLHAQLGRGAPMHQIQTAVKAAGGDLDVAERVLLVLEQGEDVPATSRGIWTSEDDAALRANHETRLIPLVKKHGRKLMEERRDFLRGFEGEDEE